LADCVKQNAVTIRLVNCASVAARARCPPKGRCQVGWIVSNGGRESHDVWLGVRTGLVKLIRQADA
jgi:hypothetical protein